MDIILFCLNDWLSSLSELIGTILPPDVRGAFVGAIIGAMGAYIVSQKTLKNERIGKRWGEHRNSLVKLESLLNEMIDIISCNNYASKKIIDVENVDLREIKIAWSKPNSFPSEFNQYFPLLRIKLINELFSYKIKIRRVNNDISNINFAYSEMINALLSKNISKEQYLTSFEEYKNCNSELIKAYELLEKQSIKLLANVTIALDKDKKLDKKYSKKLPDLIDINDDEIQAEIHKIKDTIEEVVKNSRKELDEHGITKRRNC